MESTSGNGVFGKVSAPATSWQGPREQDIELFDSTVKLPRISAPGRRPAAHAAGRARHRSATTGGARTRAARAKDPSHSLTLALTLMVGLSAALTVYLIGGRTGEPRADRPPVPPVLPASEPPAEPSGAPHPSTTAPPPPTTAASSASAPAHTPAAGTSTAATGPAGGRPAIASGTPAREHRPPQAPPPAARHSPHSHHEGNHFPDTVAVGSSGPLVADLQQRLQRLGLYLGSADGYFDTSLETALLRYQKARNIPQENGAYGPLTRAVLTAETE
ncbi:peptidoglycan-binding protein [Streptomyces andamanensis]|uniref:Peptidoglycan-binding protein n=2 Tax=Streptomyces TaxID=1883 RepID=A0ABV8TJZ5_9ACTN